MLQRRALQAYTRNPANVANRTVMSLFIGLIGGLVFHRRAPGRDGVTQDIDAIFFLTLVLALVPFTYMCARPRQAPCPASRGLIWCMCAPCPPQVTENALS